MLIGLLLLLQQPQLPLATPEIVSFQNDNLTLRGVLYKPGGSGPFPGLIYNHGSAPEMLNNQAFEELGPLFARRSRVFFAPYRRGQGLSATAGPFIGDEIAAARNKGIWLALFVVIPFLVLLFLVITRKRRGWFRIVWGVAFGLFAVLVVHLSGARAGGYSHGAVCSALKMSRATVSVIQRELLRGGEGYRAVFQKFFRESRGHRIVGAIERFLDAITLPVKGSPSSMRRWKRSLRRLRLTIIYF